MTHCHCGRPLHYTNPQMQAFVEALIADLGPTVCVTVNGRTWRVPRHYIALHGLKATDVAMLGFEEVLPTFEIRPAAPGRPAAIRCRRCGFVSYHRQDIAQRYCGRCHVFHEDLNGHDIR